MGQPPASSAQGPALRGPHAAVPEPRAAGTPRTPQELRAAQQALPAEFPPPPPRRPFRDTRRGLRGLNLPAHENPSPMRYVLWVPEARPAFASVYLSENSGDGRHSVSQQYFFLREYFRFPKVQADL